MAKLVLSHKGQVLGQFFPDRDRFTIGRREGNDIHIDDAGVSKEHAVILTVGNDQIIEDQNSTNGVLVNGVRVFRHILQHNDVIDIHGYQLKYINQKAARQVEFDQTMMISGVDLDAARPAGPPAQPAAPVPGTRPSGVNFPQGAVKVLAGPGAGGEIALDRYLRAFGDETGSQVAIARRPHGFFLMQVAGAAGKLNDRPLAAAPQALNDADLIEAGEVRLQFERR